MARWHHETNLLRRNQSVDLNAKVGRMNSYFENGAFYQTKQKPEATVKPVNPASLQNGK